MYSAIDNLVNESSQDALSRNKIEADYRDATKTYNAASERLRAIKGLWALTHCVDSFSSEEYSMIIAMRNRFEAERALAHQAWSTALSAGASE